MLIRNKTENSYEDTSCYKNLTNTNILDRLVLVDVNDVDQCWHYFKHLNGANLITQDDMSVSQNQDLQNHGCIIQGAEHHKVCVCVSTNTPVAYKTLL